MCKGEPIFQLIFHFLLALAVGGPIQLAVGEDTLPAAAPNVVMFFIDDLGAMDVGCYGSTNYATPNIDRLASRGVRFTQFYSANPVCSPTRAALMTGKAPHRLGITQWINQPNEIHLPLAEVTLAETLKAAGYQTAYIGKWHLGEKDQQLPTAQGFDWMRGVNRAGAPGSYFFPFQRKKGKKANGVPYWDVPDLADRQPGDYLTDELTDKALEFIETNQAKPFFLCFAHYAVHTPIQAPEPLVKKYQERFDQLPKLESSFLPERNESRSRARQDNPTYAAMVENLDDNVGRVIDKLEQLNLDENTIVVFTSDNGGLSTTPRIGPTSCRPLRAGKGWTYEGGIRIPTMITWPGKLQPATASVPGITMDLYPTILELTGQSPRPEQHLDGASLVTALRGTPSDQLKNRFLGWTYPHHHGSNHSPSNAIREGNWKLIQKIDDQTPDDDRLELYRLDQDPSEEHNLAKENPEKAQQLLGKLTQWLESSQPGELPWNTDAP